MRFLVFPLFATLTVAGIAAPVAHRSSAVAPAPLVILVHGRGHLDDDSASLRRAWKRDLDSALAIVGLPKLRDEDVRLAWYADVLDPQSESGCRDDRFAGDDSVDFGAVARGFLGSLTSALSKDESRGLRGLIGDMLYVVDGSMRCAAEQRVGSAIERAIAEKRPVIVVAYSLGSLVTFGYLSSLPRDLVRSADLRLITLGSPLGVPELRDLMMGDQRTTLERPAGVTAWENIYDPYDMFSSPLERVVVGKSVRDRVTQSSSADDAHQIDRYLRDRATGIALANALCASARDRIGDACGRLPAN